MEDREHHAGSSAEGHKSYGSFAAGVALGVGLLVFVRYRGTLRPYLVDAFKELIEFKEWLFTLSEDLRADIEDLMAEATQKHAEESARQPPLAAKKHKLSKKCKDKENGGPSNA